MNRRSSAVNRPAAPRRDGHTIRGARIEGRSFGFAALAAFLAGFWSLMSGTVVAMAFQAVGKLVA